MTKLHRRIYIRAAKRKLKNVWYEDGGRYRMKARLHPRWVGGRAGYLSSAIFDGKLIL